MSERQIERALVKQVTKCGGLCPKWMSPGWDGVPDRMCLFDDGKIGFVEVKRKGAKPRRLQTVRHKKLKILGFKVFILDDAADIPGIIEEIKEQ